MRPGWEPVGDGASRKVTSEGLVLGCQSWPAGGWRCTVKATEGLVEAVDFGETEDDAQEAAEQHAAKVK